MNASNPFAKKKSLFEVKERIQLNLLRLACYTIIGCAIFIFSDIVVKGAPTFFKAEAPFVNTEFFTKSPEILSVWYDQDGVKYSMTKSDADVWQTENPDLQVIDLHDYAASGGGILGPLLGTGLLVVCCMILALFIGVSAAIYLSEYCGKHDKLMNLVRLSILNLAGVPSIVFALFGWGIFCHMAPIHVSVSELSDTTLWAFPFAGGYISFQGWDTSLLAGACTLAIMVLPVIITACEESLQAVPKGFREASYALGATQWQTIRKAVLPFAVPGVLTATVLGITRVAGETAPIMLTATVTEKGNLPFNTIVDEGVWGFFSQSVQALPFHIYTLSKLPASENVKPMQYGSIFAFLLLVMGFALISILLRNRIRKKLKW